MLNIVNCIIAICAGQRVLCLLKFQYQNSCFVMSRVIERIHSRGQRLCKFIGTKEIFLLKKSPTPKGFVWSTSMAAMSLFWNTNMVAVMSCEYALLPLIQPESSRVGSCLFNIQFFTSNTVIKIIHIHSFDPEGDKIYQPYNYLLHFHLLNSH